MEWLSNNWLAVTLIVTCVSMHLLCMRGHGDHGHKTDDQKKIKEAAGMRLGKDAPDEGGTL